jgi:hypothetical protein
MGGGTCANARSADAAVTVSKSAVLFFMDSPIIYDPAAGHSGATGYVPFWRHDSPEAYPLGKPWDIHDKYLSREKTLLPALPRRI